MESLKKDKKNTNNFSGGQNQSGGSNKNQKNKYKERIKEKSQEKYLYSKDDEIIIKIEE